MFKTNIKHNFGIVIDNSELRSADGCVKRESEVIVYISHSRNRDPCGSLKTKIKTYTAAFHHNAEQTFSPV